ncbi:MAG: 4'-phosphopantetheinyl transferase family protein [Bdellovibrio sp.]
MINANAICLFEITETNLENAKIFLQQQIQQQGVAVFYIKNNEAVLPPTDSFLTDSEIQTVSDFKSKDRQLQHLVSQWLLKTLLAFLTGIEARALTFEKGSLGKPYLTKAQNFLNLDFNISHTRDITLIGFAKEMQIGVDVEKVVEKKNSEKLAERFFQPSELEWITSAIDNKEKQSRFFRIWSMKEAVIKTIGGGVFQNIHQFSLVKRNGQLELQSIVEPWNYSNRWTTFEFTEIADHACSVALLRNEA